MYQIPSRLPVRCRTALGGDESEKDGVTQGLGMWKASRDRHLKKWCQMAQVGLRCRTLTTSSHPTFKPIVCNPGFYFKPACKGIGLGTETFLHDSIAYIMCLGQGLFTFIPLLGMKFPPPLCICKSSKI